MKDTEIQPGLGDFQAALDAFIGRLKKDSYLLAAVLVGSLVEETVCRRNSISLWLIEADGVSKRLRSDGEEVRVFRSFVEQGINIHVEVIPRSRFRLMIEGNSRTAYRCSFFAARELVYCNDASIENWFEQANSLAITDQKKNCSLLPRGLLTAIGMQIVV